MRVEAPRAVAGPGHADVLQDSPSRRGPAGRRSLAAEHLEKSGKTVSSGKLFTSAVAAFCRTYILKQGFRDGVQGMIIAMFTAYGVFLKYAKLWERRNNTE